ncbi:DUF6058 family natural product biosynthesis protein [Gallaecimonas sp. GXIMD4217]|uniref:DUF6058 family natural product biosynthesis protein n=1 Tax=Gallaecimonas sp. GXIMD4217 TaxID=3131927 RepID=UPI00311B2A4D
MALLDYLQSHFLTETQLLAQTGCDREQLHAWQQQGLMPAPSYRLALSLLVESFFGSHQEGETLSFYAKGYGSWLGLLAGLGGDVDKAFGAFAGRYRARVQTLSDQGFRPGAFFPQGKLATQALDDHINNEWQHFLAGTYGLCTHSGLPEAIADKEIAIRLIDDITDRQQRPTIEGDDRSLLARAVVLLDEASSPFAPHERLRSSRHRCIDEVRRRYRL